MSRLSVEWDWLSVRLGAKLHRYFNWRTGNPVLAGWELEICLPFVSVYWESKP
jgi:hypothetical protein